MNLDLVAKRQALTDPMGHSNEPGMRGAWKISDIVVYETGPGMTAREFYPPDRRYAAGWLDQTQAAVFDMWGEEAPRPVSGGSPSAVSLARQLNGKAPVPGYPRAEELKDLF